MTPLLDIPRAAKLLSISPWTVRNYIAQGKLNPVRIGRRVLLEESELLRFVARSRRNSVPVSEAQVPEGAE
jgi:excisionase family DNA binding protein